MNSKKMTIRTTHKDFPLSVIKDMCEGGEMIPNPKWQREDVYNKEKASRLVESILIGIPIPTIYLCEEQDGTLSVIDGQQRIISFVKFLRNEYRLCGLPIYTELNGSYFKDLDRTTQRELKAASLSIECLDKESSGSKFELFFRYNQGAVLLKPQEIRNCVYMGPYNDMLEELARNRHLPGLLHVTNKRRCYQECILRFFTLRNFMAYRTSSIKKAMNDYMKDNQHAPKEVIAKHRKLFNQTVELVKLVLGDSAFIAVDGTRERKKGKFSTSVFDSVMIGFSYFTSHDIMPHADEIRTAVNNLKQNNAQYRDDTSDSTHARRKVIGRIMGVYKTISEIVGRDSESDERLFSEDVKKMLFRPGYKCSYCGNEILDINDAEIDHILAFSLGGKTEPENAQLLHRMCNQMKSAAFGADLPAVNPPAADPDTGDGSGTTVCSGRGEQYAGEPERTENGNGICRAG